MYKKTYNNIILNHIAEFLNDFTVFKGIYCTGIFYGTIYFFKLVSSFQRYLQPSFQNL